MFLGPARGPAPRATALIVYNVFLRSTPRARDPVQRVWGAREGMWRPSAGVAVKLPSAWMVPQSDLGCLAVPGAGDEPPQRLRGDAVYQTGCRSAAAARCSQ